MSKPLALALLIGLVVASVALRVSQAIDNALEWVVCPLDHS